MEQIMYERKLIDIGAKSGVKYWIDTNGELVNSETNRVVGGRIKNGYRLVCVNGTWKALHRFVAEAFCHKPKGCNEVNHINGIKSDNRAENLEWTTHKENMQHAVRTGLWKSYHSEKAYRAKLLNKDVIAVCKHIANGGTWKSLKDKSEYLTKDIFYNIKFKRSWTSISKDYF